MVSKRFGFFLCIFLYMGASSSFEVVACLQLIVSIIIHDCLIIFFCTWAFLEYSQSLAAQLQWSSTEPRVQQRGQINPDTLIPTFTTKQKNIIKGWLTVKTSMDEDEEENTLHCWRDGWMLSLFRIVVWTCDNCNLNSNVSYWQRNCDDLF